MEQGESQQLAGTATMWLTKPFSLLDEVEREFGEIFRAPLTPVGGVASAAAGAPLAIEPSFDICEDNGNVVVKAELSGVAKEDLELKIAENILTISGSKKRERSFAAFSRSYRLPAPVQADKVKARFKEGVLEIVIPKTAKELRKERQIRIE